MADEDVLCHIQIRKDHGFLKDGCNAKGLCFLSIRNSDRLPLKQNFSLVSLLDTGQDFDQC